MHVGVVRGVRQRSWRGATAMAALALVIGTTSCSSDADGRSATSDPGSTTSAAAPAVDAQCATTHAGHMTSMWNPFMADEMVTMGCAWPYEPFDPPSGDAAEEDAALPAFTPVLYSQLWSATSAAGLGVCSVGTLPDPSENGFAFGFDYAVAAPACPAGPTAHMVVREFVSRGDRDAAAHADRGSAPRFVLGRWVIDLDGDDESVQSLSKQLALLSAEAVPV